MRHSAALWALVVTLALAQIWSLALPTTVLGGTVGEAELTMTSVYQPGAAPAGPPPGGNVNAPPNAQDESSTSSAFVPANIAANTQDDPPQLGPTPQIPGWIVEQSVYIPYEKLRTVFEKQERGVFIPYAQFDALWKQAQANLKETMANAPPTAFGVIAADSQVILERQVAKVTTKLSIEFLKTGWQEVPLNLSQISLHSATIQGASIDSHPARITKKEDGSFWLIEEIKTAPQSVELNLEYAIGFSPQVGQNKVSFGIPQATINRWVIATADENVEIQVAPAAVVTDSQIDELRSNELKSRITALLGNSPTIEIAWTPKSIGAAGLSALITASSETRVRLQKNLTSLRQSIRLDVQRASVNQLSFRPPAGFRVLDVIAPNVKRWQMDESNQNLQVEFFEPVKGVLDLRMNLEAPESERQNNQWNLGSVEVLNATQQPGRLYVETDPYLRAQMSSAIGLTRTDRDPAAAQSQSETPSFAFLYDSVPYHAVFDVTEIAPRVKANLNIAARLQPTQLTADWLLRLDVADRGIYSVAIDVPAAWEVTQVVGQAVDNYAAALVEKFAPAPENPQRLIVEFSKEALGPVALVVRITQKVAAPPLLDQPGVAVEIPILWPTLVLDGVESSQCVLTLSYRDSLSLTTAENPNYRQLTSDVATGDDWQMTQFEFVNQPAALQVTATRRKPRVFVDQFILVAIESGAVRQQADLDFEIRFSPVKSLRIDIPTAIENRLQLTNSDYQWQRLDPQPTDVAANESAWEVRGPLEWLGNYRLNFSWETPLSDIALGTAQTFNIQGLKPRGADRARGQVVIKRTELFDVQTGEDATGLRPIDPTTDLFGQRQLNDTVAAFEFVDQWNLNTQISRFDLFDLARTNIPKGLVRAVWLRQGELSVQAVYQVQSVLQRLTIQMPPDFDSERGFGNNAVRIDGNPVAIERGAAGQLVINLGNRDRTQTLLLEIRYNMPARNAEIPVPTFLDDCAVQSVKLLAYVPPELMPLYVTGPWSDLRDQQEPYLIPRLLQPRGDETASSIDWIKTSDSLGQALRQFETDGQCFAFSTMNPPAGPRGALRLSLFRHLLFHSLLCGGIVLIGLLLTATNDFWRLGAIVLLLTGLLLTAVWSPILIESITWEYLFGSLFIVIFVWIIRQFTSSSSTLRTRFFPTKTSTNAASTTPASNALATANSATANSATTATPPAAAGPDQPGTP